MGEGEKNAKQDEDVIEARIGQVLNEFLDRRAVGEAVTEAELLAQHPELAEELQAHFELLREIEPTRAAVSELLDGGILARTTDRRYAAELGPFKILRLLGRGGMGIVLKAYDVSLQRFVALKLLRAELSGNRTALARFEREAKAAGALRHSNIITVHAVGEEQGTRYIVMEFVDGPTLARMVRDEGPLPADKIRVIFRRILSGLAAAHEAGLIHRDIKSTNILLSGDEPQVKIADFGLARALSGGTRITLTGSVFGTPEYMSPEQARGDDNIDHRTDLYSAGVILYEMLTGRPPFKADSGSAVIHQILYDDPPDPRTIYKTADPQLSALALRLMAKRVEERFANAAEAAETLEGRQPGSLPRRTMRIRYWLVAGLAVIAAIVLVSREFTPTGVKEEISSLHPAAARTIQRIRIAPEPDRATTIEAQYGVNRDWAEFVSLPAEVLRVADAALVVTPDDVFVVAGAGQPVNGDSLFAFRQDGTLAWRLDLSDPRRWPDCSPPSKWKADQVLAVELDGKVRNELIVVATELDEYPTRVSIIDPVERSIKSTFWHMGGLGEPLWVRDFSGPERPAIVIPGLNNKLDGFDDGLSKGERQFAHWDIVPVVMVLDPYEFEGVGPPPSSRFPDLPRASVNAYAYLDMPYAPRLLWVTQPGVGQPPKKGRAAHLTRDDMGYIRSIKPSLRAAAAETGPWFEVDVWSHDEGGHDVGRAILTVDRNLNLVAVTPASVAGEIVGTDVGYWEQFWMPLIQDGEYVTD